MARLPLDQLDPTGFEEFAFELLGQIGLINLDWRKGTDLSSSPADGGRDIVGQVQRVDIDGTVRLETWFIDCKLYKKGVPPSELQGLLAWANAERPDVALFLVGGFLSNPSKDYLKAYERNTRPPFRIKFWERPVLERMSDGKDDFLRRFFIDLPRSEAEILEAEQEFFDRVWYGRHEMFIERVESGRDTTPEDIVAMAREAGNRVRDQYGADALGPYSDFEWGMINGKLSTLRWILGDEWDMLDT